jgi:hypothetical protein
MVPQLLDDLGASARRRTSKHISARQGRGKGDKERIRDFNLALRIAQQQSVLAAPELTGASDNG